ncbi:MAG: hypothetical protein OEY56_10475, partial [Cyclobacteriaceae bacterium]|nr:hypothetical protein [Cyclobacteriaceae bacterium]
MRKLLTVIFLIPLFYLFAQPEGAFLVVDPQGHNAVVNGMAYSPLTHELITVSDDKTIRFWELEDQVLNRTFRVPSRPNGPEGMLYASSLSPDGRWLSVAGYTADNDIKIIDIQSSEIVDVLVRHQNVVTDLEFSPDGNMLASAGADNRIVLWEKSGSSYVYKRTLSKHQQRVNDLEFSPDGSKIVSVSDDATICVWDLKQTEENEPVVLQNHLGPIKKVSGSPVGFLTGGEDGILNLWSWQGGLIRQVTQFSSPVVAIETSPFSPVAFVSADRQVLIQLDNPSAMKTVFSTNRNVTSAVFQSKDWLLLGQGREGNVIGVKLSNLAPEYAMTGNGRTFGSLKIKGNYLGLVREGQTNPESLFDFEKGKINRDKSELTGFNGPNLSDGTFRFTKIGTSQLSYGSDFSITNDRNDGRILCYTLLSDGNIVVGSDRTLKIYSASGRLIKTLSGHNGQVLSVVANKNYFFTYGGDQLIKVWNIRDHSLAYNLFVTKDYEWILWNTSGRYTASAGGEKFLVWQVNKAVDQLAEFFDVSTYQKDYMASSVSEVSESANDEAAQSEALPFKPSITWKLPVAYQSTVTSNTVRIQASIISAETVLKVRILVEGKPLPITRGVSVLTEINEIIPITSYKTTVQIFASTENAKIISEKRVFINPAFEGSSESSLTIMDVKDKPDLYYLGIGISEFQNPSFNLTFADDDARSLYSTFADKKSPAFNNFYGTNLLNGEATKENILAALRDITTKVTPRDHVVLFIASHGINSNGLYYVLPTDARESDLKGTCLNWNEIASILS